MLGLTEVATESIGFIVGNGEGMLVTATPDTLYPPEADITMPVTIENIGTFHTNSVINVTMLEETETLQEVVVVGYGTMKKTDLTLPMITALLNTPAK